MYSDQDVLGDQESKMYLGQDVHRIKRSRRTRIKMYSGVNMYSDQEVNMNSDQDVLGSRDLDVLGS